MEENKVDNKPKKPEPRRKNPQRTAVQAACAKFEEEIGAASS